MKQYQFIIFLLFMTLTGCSDNTEGKNIKKTVQTNIEEETTQISIETESITNTENLNFQLYSEFIQNTLIPEFGLSDMKPFIIDTEIQPHTRGIISAWTQDFTGDTIPELLTVRADADTFYLECWNPVDETMTLLGSQQICTLVPQQSIIPMISIQNDKIIIETRWMNILGQSSYGNEISILSVTENGFQTVLSATASRVSGNETLTINDVSFTGHDFEPDYETYRLLLCEALVEADIAYQSADAGWLKEILYGIVIEFSDTFPLFSYHTDSEQDMYILYDGSNLRQ